MAENPKYATKYPERPKCPHCGCHLILAVDWLSRVIHMECVSKACGYGCNLHEQDFPEWISTLLDLPF